jgi:hypothetical protein
MRPTTSRTQTRSVRSCCCRSSRRPSEQDAVSAQKLGQLHPFIAVFPQKCTHGPTCIFWANLTPFSLQPSRAADRHARAELPDGALRAGACGSTRTRSHCRFVLQLIHCITDLLRDSVPLFLKRQCDRTPGPTRHIPTVEGLRAEVRSPSGASWCAR